MILTKEKLITLWKMRDKIFDENKEILSRYEFVDETFNQIFETRVQITKESVIINNKPLLIDGKQPSLKYFGCKDDGVTRDQAFEGVKEMQKGFDDTYKELVERIGCLLGGFDFENNQMKDTYRIISNIVKDKNDNGSLTSKGLLRHPSSHFADNNYFFNVVYEVNRIKEDTFNPNESRIVLRYPNNKDVDTEKKQRDILNCRFPYKFFYMWANKETVIHPVSLLAYRNLVQQENKDFWYDSNQKMDENINWAYDEKFRQMWSDYSKQITDYILGVEPEPYKGENIYVEISKLLSIVMMRDQDMKDYCELLETGSKALILWGPPGTGKTYAAKKIVQKILGITETELNDYSFEKGEKSDKGQWAIVQFHPSYSYEDFIGGISPKLDGNTLAYCLKEGVFKRFCDEAAKHEGKYVFVIDEINRADLSTVFGELMYALEYRGEAIMLPNFTKPFIIPKNVYVIGTMNSVDKSLATFDLALRRRFSFYKVMPNLKALETILGEAAVKEDDTRDFIRRCNNLNQEISNPQGHFKLGADYQIGHAYFAKIRDFLLNEPTSEEEKVYTIDTFAREKLWMYHLRPLLEEYLGNRIEDGEINNLLEEQGKKFVSNK